MHLLNLANRIVFSSLINHTTYPWEIPPFILRLKDLLQSQSGPVFDPCCSLLAKSGEEAVISSKCFSNSLPYKGDLVCIQYYFILW